MEKNILLKVIENPLQWGYPIAYYTREKNYGKTKSHPANRMRVKENEVDKHLKTIKI